MDRLLSCLAAMLLIVSGCAVKTSAAEPPTTLRVALFPYIPDAAGDQFAALRQRLKKEFEADHPTVQLTVDPINTQSEVFYDLTELEKLLSPSAQPAADLVEIDTLFLGELIADDKIEKWDALPRPEDWHPAAVAAVTVNGDCYGTPHWLCSFFVYSHIPEMSDVHTSDDLVRLLDTKGVCATHLTGNFAGSFTLPAIYLDAFAETHGAASAATGLARPADKDVAAKLKAVVAEGAHGGVNPCIDGTLKDDKDITAVVPDFAHGKYDCFFGYSERLQHILSDNPAAAPWTIIPAPLGQGGSPLLYVDALVMRKGLTAAQAKAAKDFAEYLNRPATQEWVLLSQDGQNAMPRYLLPATKSAFQSPGIRANRYFATFEASIANGRAMPTSGYLERKDDLKNDLLQLISGN
jgi:thiamine pyridinylase